MKVGIVGAGAMGRTHAVGWRQTDAEMVGVVATNRSQAEALSETLNASVYDDFSSLLKDVDAIGICTPTHLHHEMVMQAIDANVHIFCEKPIALNLADGVEMIRTAEAAGVRLFIGMVLHFFPEYTALKQSINGGAVGNPRVIRMSRASYRPQRPADDWFMKEAQSGGMIVDLMIHDFEMSRWLAKGDVQRVFAKAIRRQKPEVLGDHALAILRFDNGAMAHIEGSWAYPMSMFNVRAEVAGDKGLIEWESDKSTPLMQHRHAAVNSGGDVALPGSPLAEAPWTTEVKHFYQSLVDGTDFAVSPLDALKGLQIALAAQESTRTGKAITLESLEIIS
ncbi:MAG: Gfo/Idh/MocA family protein [Aggregatilineales bacterium]